MNWTLIVVAVIILLSGFIGLHKGIIKMAISVFSLIIVGILAAVITPITSNFLSDNTEWDDAIRGKTETYYKENGVLLEYDADIDTSKLPLPQNIIDKIEENEEKYINQGYEVYNNYVIDTTTNLIFNAIIYVTVFILLYIILGVVGMIVDFAAKLPVIKQVNKIAGLFSGLLLGVLIVWIAFIFISISINFNFSEIIFIQIKESKFLSFLYENNFLLKFILRKI